MEEGEQKLCLVEPTLELMEKTPLQVQMQLLEKMGGGEALAAEDEPEVMVVRETLILIHQEQMEAAVELVVMEAAAEQGAVEGGLLTPIQGQEVQEVLVVLEEEAEEAEVLRRLEVLTEELVMVVMVELVVMAEVEGVAATAIQTAAVASVVAALVALD